MNCPPRHTPQMDVKAHLELKLDETRKRNLYRTLVDDWARVRDQIITTTLTDSSDQAQLADIESRAIARLFEQEEQFYHDLLIGLVDDENNVEADELQTSGDSDPMKTIRVLLTSVSHFGTVLTQYVALSVDKLVFRFSPSSYRRRVSVDTAKTITRLCASTRLDDQLKRAALTRHIWEAATKLEDAERTAFVRFVVKRDAPKQEYSTDYFLALAAAAFQVGEGLDDGFDAAVRESRPDKEHTNENGYALTEPERVRRVLGVSR